LGLTYKHLTNPPNAAELIDRAVPCIEYLVEHGCPGLPDQIVIEQDVAYFKYSNEIVIHDPAVLDSIVVWVNGTVAMWAVAEDSTMFQDLACPGIWDESTWLIGLSKVAYYDTYPEATIALLEAITEAVKGGGA